MDLIKHGGFSRCLSVGHVNKIVELVVRACFMYAVLCHFLLGTEDDNTKTQRTARTASFRAFPVVGKAATE